ncbi:hypothetical protein C6P42_003721, partial [Pichia californica]
MSDKEKDNSQVDLHSTFSKDNINTEQVLSHIVSIDGRVVDITGDVDEAIEYALDTEDVVLTPEPCDNINTEQVLSHIVSIDGRVVDITGDVDEAMEYALDAEDVVLTPEQEKKLLRKIDFCLLPLI